MDTPDRKSLPRKLNKREKTNEKRYHPTKKKPTSVSHIHICLLHLFTEERHVLGRRGHLTLPLLMSLSCPHLC